MSYFQDALGTPEDPLDNAGAGPSGRATSGQSGSGLSVAGGVGPPELQYAGSTYQVNSSVGNQDEGDTISVILEEPWNEILETELRMWAGECKTASIDHSNAGYRLKRKFLIMNFATIAWSSVILLVNGMLQCEDEFYVRFFTLIINAFGIFLSGINSSMNLGNAYRTHFDYEARFFDLCMDIEHMLCRERRFRLAADAFMTEVRERRKKLQYAPELPRSKWFFC